MVAIRVGVCDCLACQTKNQWDCGCGGPTCRRCMLCQEHCTCKRGRWALNYVLLTAPRHEQWLLEGRWRLCHRIYLAYMLADVFSYVFRLPIRRGSE